MLRRRLLSAPVSLCLIITACGCGSNNSPSNNPPPTNPVPAITSVTPSSASAGAATINVVLTGAGFVNGATILWNGVALTTTFNSATELSATVPASDLATGVAANVTVANPGPSGGVSAASSFTVSNPVPTVTVNPGRVPVESADTTIDLTGSGMVPSSVVTWITTTAGQYPPLSGEPYPSTILAYTLPPGTPGWADLQISAPIGTGTLPKSVFYAQSVTDYTSPDSFTAVLVDPARSQVYLSAGDHLDVFSTTSNQFVTQLHPAALGSQKKITGLALTPDGSQLLVADLLDGSLAVINPDTPSNTYAIPIAPVTGLGTTNGPLYVAATSENQAFVTTGGLPATACPSSGITYIANLQTHAVTRPAAYSQCHIGLLSPPFTDGFSVDASGDGNFVAIGSSTYNSACIYSVQNSSYNAEPLSNIGYGYGIAISSDGNVIGSNQVLDDVSSNLLGAISHPIPLYGNPILYTPSQYPLLRPRLNASGSLYYFAYQNYFEIIDVAHALLRMRFALTETIQNTASPLAIDSGGRYVYLLTDKGLTVVDLGAAPLSIGHLSQQTASVGTQITVRGSGFDSSTQASVGRQGATVTVTDRNTLTLTLPAAASGPENIGLTRSNGDSYTLENAVVLQ